MKKSFISHDLCIDLPTKRNAGVSSNFYILDSTLYTFYIMHKVNALSTEN